jgi:hypothetical protein
MMQPTKIHLQSGKLMLMAQLWASLHLDWMVLMKPWVGAGAGGKGRQVRLDRTRTNGHAPWLGDR